MVFNWTFKELNIALLFFFGEGQFNSNTLVPQWGLVLKCTNNFVEA
jgi:hypothetical protein